MAIQQTGPPKINWIIVLISSGVIVSVGMGIRQSFGLFLLPISDVLGEGRTLFSLAIALQNLTWGLAAPVLEPWRINMVQHVYVSLGDYFI